MEEAGDDFADVSGAPRQCGWQALSHGLVMGTNFSRVFALVGGVEDRAQCQEIFLGEVLGHLAQAFKNLALFGDDNDEQA